MKIRKQRKEEIAKKIVGSWQSLHRKEQAFMIAAYEICTKYQSGALQVPPEISYFVNKPPRPFGRRWFFRPQIKNYKLEVVL